MSSENRKKFWLRPHVLPEMQLLFLLVVHGPTRCAALEMVQDLPGAPVLSLLQPADNFSVHTVLAGNRFDLPCTVCTLLYRLLLCKGSQKE